jgi:DoxX-like family/Domain of unknown function (DUF4345)
MTQRIVSWLGRFVLLAATAIFTLIGVRYLTNPVGAAAEFHTTFASPAGATSMRVGFGAFPLAFAGLLAVSLFSARRRLFGLTMVAVIMGLATGARLLGIIVDGPAVESSRLLAPEIVMTVLSTFCAVYMWSRGPAASAPRAVAFAGDDHAHVGRRRTGAVLVGFVAVALFGSALTKFLGVPPVVAKLADLGFGRLVPLVAALELTSALLVAFTVTRPLGLLFMSAFLGGAVAAHLGHQLSPDFLGPAVVLGLLWLGAWLRRPVPAALARDHSARVTTMDGRHAVRERASA